MIVLIINCFHYSFFLVCPIISLPTPIPPLQSCYARTQVIKGLPSPSSEYEMVFQEMLTICSSYKTRFAVLVK